MVLNLQTENHKLKFSESQKLDFSNTNAKELELLKQRIEEVDKENNFLIYKNNEEFQSIKENFISFVQSSEFILKNIKNLFIALQKYLNLNESTTGNMSSRHKYDESHSNYPLSLDKVKIFEKIDQEIHDFQYLINQVTNYKSADDEMLNYSNDYNKKISFSTLSLNKKLIYCCNNNNYIDNKKSTYNNCNYNFNKYCQNKNLNNFDNHLFDNNSNSSIVKFREKNEELIELINKLEVKNKILEEENQVLNYNYNMELKHKFAEDKINSEFFTLNAEHMHKINNHFNEEINKLTEKNKALTGEIEKLKSEFEEENKKLVESEAMLIYTKKLNKDLNMKNEILEEELLKLKESRKNANDKLLEFNSLKLRYEGLEKEIH